MTEDLERVVRGYYEAVDAGDVARVVDHFTEDAVYRRPGYAPLRGREQLETFYRQDRVIASGSHLLEAVIVQADGAAVRGTFSGRLRDGAEVTVGFADFFTIHGGRIGERHTYFERPAV